MEIASYRLYCLDNGSIMKGDWIEAADDSGARDKVRLHHPDVDCELWLGDRFVAKVPAGCPPVLIDPL